MQITRLKMNPFGKFHNITLELKPGINLIYGENEAGKTTVHTFIKGMLFGIEPARGRGAASKDDIYMKYLPWNYPGAYRGQMDLLLQGKEYRLLRSFHKNHKSFSVLELETGRELKLTEGLISELIPGLTEASYRNTVSIGQLSSRTDAELASQVSNYITNLSVTKSKEVDIKKALTFLNDQKKALEAADPTEELKRLSLELEEGAFREERLNELVRKLRRLQAEEAELTASLERDAEGLNQELMQRIDQLPAILEKYEAYRVLVRQERFLELQIEERKESNTSLEKEAGNLDSIRKELKEAGDLCSSLPLYESKLKQLREEKKEARGSRTRRNILSSILPACMIAIPAVLLLPSPFRIPVFAGSILAGGLLYLFLGSRNHRVLQEYGDRLKEQELLYRKADSRWRVLADKYKVSTPQEIITAQQEKLLGTVFSLEQGRLRLEEFTRSRSELEDKADLLLDQIMTYMQYFLAEDELNDAAVQKLKEQVQAKKQEALEKLEERKRQLNACRLEAEKLRWEIGALEGNEEQLLRKQEDYDLLEQKQKETAQELDAIHLALSTIQSLSTDIHDSYGQELNAAVSEMMKEVTDHKYTDLKLDERLEVKVCHQGEYVPLDRLSAGTMDQVYLSLRLAAADLLLGKEELPLLLDDSFAFYDENRIKAAIKRLAGRGQLLIFTCHKRERRILEELGLPYHDIELTETPLNL